MSAEQNFESVGRLKSYKEVVWTEEIDACLDQQSDQAIGLRFGISPGAIARRRRLLGIVSHRYTKRSKPIEWTADAVQLLGTMTDIDLAKQLGSTPYWVRKKRYELGIEPYQMPEEAALRERRSNIVWTDEEIALLGTKSDPEIAKLLGVHPASVTLKRKKMGIAPSIEMDACEWTTQMLGLLGEVSDNFIGREYGISPITVKVKRLELGIPPVGKTMLEPPPELPLDVIELIGKKPDKQLADIYKVSRVHIRYYRAIHHIPAAEYLPIPEFQWKSEHDAQLGTMSDGMLGRLLQISTRTVLDRRKKLGIPAFRRTAVEWTEELIAQLGTEPDHLLAQRWNVGLHFVIAKRNELGIPACADKSRPWTAEEISLLGTMQDKDVAQLIGTSPTIVLKKRAELNIAPSKHAGAWEWTREQISRLGTVPDAELAVELGLSHQYVAKIRRQHEIPSYRRTKANWTTEMLAMLGKYSDRHIADLLGVTTTVVRLKRVELGIEAY
jgi:hypothetical protein